MKWQNYENEHKLFNLPHLRQNINLYTLYIKSYHWELNAFKWIILILIYLFLTIKISL